MFFKFTYTRFTPLVGVIIVLVLALNLALAAAACVAGAALAHIGWNLV